MGPGVFCLVVLFWVDDVFAEDFAGVGDDGRVVSVDEADDFGEGVFAADAEVFECAGVAGRDGSVGANDVVATRPDQMGSQPVAGVRSRAEVLRPVDIAGRRPLF